MASGSEKKVLNQRGFIDKFSFTAKGLDTLDNLDIIDAIEISNKL